MRGIADLTRRYANGIADLTVRQNIQLHWVTIEALPDVLEGLWQVGLNTTGACGDVVRNVTGCPVAGVDADEIVDASPLVQEVSQLLAGNSDFYNLPRKFKISIAGCRSWCSYPEINDIGLTAVTRTVGGKPEIGFSLRVAGGLSAEPYLGARLNAFVRWNQVMPVVKGIAELFRDSDVLREHRERARLKFLFLRHGWTAERFLDELQGASDSGSILPPTSIRPTTFIAITSVFTRRSRLGCLTWERSPCAGALPRSRCRPPLISPSGLLAENFVPPTCRTCWS